MKPLKIKDYLEEDLGEGDVTSQAIIGAQEATGIIIAKEDCLLAGLEEAIELFRLLKLKIKTRFKDGDWVKKGEEILRVQGKARDILKSERTALNFIMRMSGIATETSNLVKKCRRLNKKIEIASTRKTTPGFRAYEKKAVRIGGGHPHRHTLSDHILIKDNHLKVVGSIKDALKRAKKSSKKVEVEVDSMEDAVVAAKERPDIIMLDNMKPRAAREAYSRIKALSKKIVVEVSGNITARNIHHYAPYADMISLGALTHSAKSKNFSLEIISTRY